MNKKYNFAFLALLIVGLISSLTINLAAQNKVSADAKVEQKLCTGEKFVMPAAIAVGNAFGDFLKIASLPADERRLAFSKLTNEQRASFIKVNLALQIVKRPDMTKEQREFVLDAISKVVPEMYDRTEYEKVRRSEQAGVEMVNRAMGLFSRKEVGDFIEPLGMDKNEEIALVQMYEDVLKNGSMSRMGIVKVMPANDRANIWKTQLAYHLATGSFSKAQNEFILEMMASLSSETFATRPTEKEGKAFISRIFSVFTRQEGFAVFMSVGIQKTVVDPPNNSQWCQCLVSCSKGFSCGSENGCMSTPDGCGPWGWLGCHYMCVAE